MYRQYPWLQEKKMQARVNNEMPIGESMHAGYNRGMRFTGSGPSNEVAEYTPSGQAIHRNEMVFGQPGRGEVVLNSNESNQLMSNPVFGGRAASPSGYQDGGVIADKDVTPKTPIPGSISTGSATRQQGIGEIKNIMNTGGVAGKIGGKEISDLKGTQGVERQVMKQEIAQRGMGNYEGMGSLSRQRAEHEGQLADVTGKVAIEGMQAKERAAGRLASEGLSEMQLEEGKRQFEVGSEQWNQSFNEQRRQFDVGSDQWNKSFDEQRRQYDQNFNEQRRQFEVGSEQWNKSFNEQRSQYEQNFNEQRRQFDIGTDQWNQSFDEQRRLNDRNFNEQRRQFDIGSDQWNQSFDEQRRLNDRNFEEQQRQFEVGSDQWDKSHEAQLDQWQKSFDEQRRQFQVGSDQWNQSFDEERRRYNNEDNRWNKSFNEQRRQFDVGSDQWTQSFNEQKRQFEVGDDNWNKTYDLQVKDFQRGLDMDKHTIDVWKDNISYRDKAYYDTRKDIDLNNEIKRDLHEKDMELIDLKIDSTKADEASKNYWANSERVYNYASTHLDGYNESTGNFTPDAEAEMFNWFKAKYPGATEYSSLEGFKNSGYKKDYEDFKEWAKTEWKAATDNRLTNPYDKMLYDARSSDELDDKSKKIIEDVLTSPEALASISGVTYNPETGQVEVKTKDSNIQPSVPKDLGLPKIPDIPDVKNPMTPVLKEAVERTNDFQKKFDSGNITIRDINEGVGLKVGTINPEMLSKIMRDSANADSPNNALYKKLVSEADPMPHISVNNVKNTISNVPEGGKVVSLEGRLMAISKGKYEDKSGRNHDAFWMIDLSTGQSRVFRGKKSADYIGDGGANMKTWALSLGE